MGPRDGPRWLDRSRLQDFIDVLIERGYRVLGPRVRDGSVVFSELTRAEALPVGWRDRQEPGSYRLEHSEDPRAFGVVHGPSGAKPLVFAPREPLLQVEMERPGGRFNAEPTLPDIPPTAVLGLRPCDLAALAVKDRVFLYDRYSDAYYERRRRALLLIAVNCTRAVATCFCTSMGAGPEVSEGYDIALTELDGGFLVRAGSATGESIVADLSLVPAAAEICVEERRALEACAESIARRLDRSDLPEVLYGALDHPRWNDVADRCLSCGNCTMVCPTCFCHDERDEPSLDGRSSLRVREWDSCFSREHAQVHGFNFRPRIRDRYRMWMLHKLATWIDQFGTSGCVGCGRCITWCPVGIDLTEEFAAIRESSP